MTGPSPGRSRRPSAGLQPKGQRRSDAPYGSLESREVPVGSLLDHTSTFRTAPTAEQHLLDEAVEQSPYKPMTPNSITVIARAKLRPGPRKVWAQLNNHLDGNTKGKYHRNTFLRAFGPVHTRAVARTSYRPFHSVQLFRQSHPSGQPILKISSHFRPRSVAFYNGTTRSYFA